MRTKVNLKMRKYPMKLLSILFPALIASPAFAQPSPNPKLAGFLEDIASEDHDLRLAARQGAGPMGAPAVAPLAKLLVDPRQDVAVAARSALEKIVHHAGRPGGEKERPMMGAELEKLLAAEQPAAVRREAVHLLGFIAGGGSVPAIARLLDDADPHVKENARLSLERIPGEAAVAALAEAVKRAGDERKPDLLYSLSKKGSAAAVPVLAAHAQPSSAAEVRLAALEGLARLGAAEAVPLFNAALDQPKGASRERLFSECLRLADALKGKGEKARAASLYRRALLEAPQDFLREHALTGACPAGEAENLDLLIAGLSDGGRKTRGLANRLLKEIKGPEVFATLRKAFAAAPKETQPALLMAMAERDRAGVSETLEQAAQSSNAELKIAALDLLGRLDAPAMAPAYREVAERGSELVKPIAIKGALQVAQGRLKSGDREQAFGLFQEILQFAAATSDQRLEALRGIIATEHAKALELTSGLLQDALLASDAAQGVVKLAAKLEAPRDQETAKKHLTGLLAGNFSEEIKTQATAQLRRFGIDPQGPAKSKGYLLNWWISTPIQDPEHKGFEQKFYPEEQVEKNTPIDFEGLFLIGPRRIRWRKIEALSADGRVDLVALFRRSENVLVYAYAEINRAREEEAIFKMGSDDGIACWLNGQRVHAKDLARQYTPDEDTVRVRLRAGTNRILLKVTQWGDDWSFSFRLLDREGKPIDLRTSAN